MAQRPVDPWAEFAVQEDDDPFAEFADSLVLNPPVSVTPQPTADELLEKAKGALNNAPNSTPLAAGSPIVQSDMEPTGFWGLVDKITSPLTDAPSRAARVVAEPFMAWGERGNNPLQKAALYGGAFTQGVGDVISAMTSPADLAAAALSGGASMAASRGLPIAGKLAMGARASSIPPALHGTEAAFNPNNDNTMAERGAGLLEAGLGGLGVRGIKVPEKATPMLPRNIPEKLPTPIESSRALLDAPDYNFSAKPDGSLPDLESYLITNNQATPGPLNPRAIQGRIGTSEVTNNAGETIRRPLTSQRPILRPDSNPDVAVEIGESAVKNKPVPRSARVSPNETVGMPPKPVPTGDEILDATTWKDYLSLPRAIQSAYDLSFPFRQGLGLIHTKGWWKAWPDMINSVKSEGAYRAVMDSISQRPNFVAGSTGKSFAEEAGLAITDLGKLGRREEELGSKIAEIIPGLRASNRAYTAFANKLRADNFDSLIQQAEAAGLDPKKNLVLSKEIASFINNASGRGSLENLEGSLVTLNHTLFSPRLIASRVQMLNPRNYIFGNSLVRKEYLKSLVALGTAWNGIAELSKLGGAEVNNDPESSDFRQIKIGNTRIDPSGGFRPYIVLARRLGEIFERDKERYMGKFGARTPLQDVSEFIQHKLAPLAAYASGPFRGTEKFPFYVGDETVKMFTPIMVQDIMELLNEDPSLIGAAGLGAVGMGVNTYAPGRQEEPRMTEPIFPKQYDLRFPRQ